MNVDETAVKIKSMEIRGAGKIARAVAAALKDLAQTWVGTDAGEFMAAFDDAKNKLQATRPTAVSLSNALTIVSNGALGVSVEEIRNGVTAAADRFIINSERAIEQIARQCSDMIKDGFTIMTHCNSSVAVKSMINAHKQGKRIKVYATETRPWLQGHITTGELAAAGLDVTLIVDSAAGYFMPETNMVIVGADTIKPDGTVVNKIGTSQIALRAHTSKVPVIVCAESYKFLTTTSEAADTGVEIEERDSAEVISPSDAEKLQGVKVRNPVFDSTAPEYIDSIITEYGIISPHDANTIVQQMLTNNRHYKN